MKILVATDGSACSHAAVSGVAARRWPEGSEVEVLHVISTRFPSIPDPTLVLLAAYETLLHEAAAPAPKLVVVAAAEIRTAQPARPVTTKVLEGAPRHVIVEEAETWAADVIVLHAHGFGAVKRLFLGSVSQAVALHATCSVEIVRTKACLDESAAG